MAERIRFPVETGTVVPIKTIGQRWSPFEDLYHSVLTIKWWQFFLGVAGAYMLANAVFALVYVAAPGSVANARPGSFEDAFYFSVQTMATIGYGGMMPANRFGHLMVTFEALVGIIAAALVTGLTFAKFARPRARVLFSDKVVVCKRDGVPHLMFRMANWRHNQVAEAQARVILLVTEKTREGDVFRVPLDIPLVRSTSAMFLLSWTALHRIDEASPFFGEDVVERLRATGAELYITITGFDQTIADTIHARHGYKLDDIVWNARFADVISAEPDGTRVVDYRHFHDVVPVQEDAA